MSPAFFAIAASALGTALIPLGVAGAMAQSGDGSFSDNPDLLRGSFAPFCEPSMLCHYGVGGPGKIAVAQGASPATARLAGSADKPSSGPDAVPLVMAGPVLVGGEPAGAYHGSPLDTRLSIGLSGSVITSGGETRYEAGITPRATFAHQGGGTQAQGSVSARLVQPDDGDLRIGSARAEGRYGRLLGPDSAFTLDGALSLNQDDPRGIDAPASGAMTAPLDFVGEADAQISHRLDRFDLALRSGLGRETFDLGGTGAGEEDDRWRFSTGLRAGYALSPIVGVFVDGSVRRDAFDRASADLGASRSGWVYDARAGIEGNWNDVWTAELTAGYGWRTFDAGVLSDAQTALYGAAIAFAPNPTTTLALRFDTELAPGTGGAAGSVDYALSLDADYRINPWLGVRGLAGARWREQEDGEFSRRYEAGAGADIAVGAHTDLNLDYGYLWRDDPGEAPAEADEHRLSAGLTLQY